VDHVPPPPPADPVLAACRRLAAAMDRFDEAACRALAVNRSDLRALNLLEHGPLRTTTIGARLGLSKPAVTQLVDRLAAAGYVRRDPDPQDRRATLVALEPATFAAFARVYAPLGHGVVAATEPLGARRRAATAKALELIAGAFDDARDALAAPPG
jgi:DNA-binding MarR family transcriptional regulator